MKRSTKTMMIIAASLCGAAILLVIAGALLIGDDIMGFGKKKYDPKTYEINDDFSNISVETNTANVKFVFVDDGDHRVECAETERLKYSVRVDGETLVVELVDTRKWYDHISIFGGWEDNVLTLYIPQAEYGSVLVDNDTGDVKIPDGMIAKSIAIETDTGDVTCDSVNALAALSISTDTGDIYLSDIKTSALSLEVNTGDVSVNNVDAADVNIESDTGKIKVYKMWCNNLGIEVDTGKVNLEDVIALGYFDIESSTGDITIEHSDASSVEITASTGDVYATFITEKIVFADTSTGDIDIPHYTSGDPCNIKTSTGDITVEIKGLKEDK